MDSYTILCVDDKEANLYALEQLLKNIPEVSVVLAKSGFEALNFLLKKSVDLILLDIQMPEMDGYEVATLVKSNQLTKEIPIVFLTAVFKSDEFKAKGFEVGAIDYLTKPIDDNQLLNKIKLYIKVLKERDKAIFLQHEYQNMTDFMGEGLYVLDTNGHIVYINQAGLNVLGFSLKEMLGKNAHEMIHYKDKFENPILLKECRIHNIFETKAPYIGQENFVKKDGTIIDILVSATPIVEKGKIIKVIVLFQDVSKIVEQERRLLELEMQKSQNYQEFISSLVTIIEKRDTYTAGHSQRVAQYCEMIARHLGIEESEIELLVNSAKLHDIGKISTPDSILLKPSKLTELEYELIKDHLKSGYDILSSVGSYKDVAELMKYHHERYDGSGYPNGFKGDEIPLLAHIMIVADSFDAMTTDRIYKQRKSVKEAILEIQNSSKIEFHPLVVKAVVEIFSDLKEVSYTPQMPTTELEMHRFSYYFKDKLTDLFLIEYQYLVQKLFLKSENPYKKIIRLVNFGNYNKLFGWQEGDKLLILFAQYLKNLYHDCIIFRIEGDDFMLLSDSEIYIDIDSIAKEIFQDSGITIFIEDGVKVTSELEQINV
ncbi:MAG: response regulator [Campylobacterales bacterium]|nr:response regulator [Campylobacterales bacterium]